MSRKKPTPAKHTILILAQTSAPTNISVYLDNYRIAGEKPWAGGRTIREYKNVDAQNIDHALGRPVLTPRQLRVLKHAKVSRATLADLKATPGDLDAVDAWLAAHGVPR